jgi:valyl-tRNA synthetase
MYLIQINQETGLIDDSPSNSGWKAIKAFRELFSKKGINAMTVVALSCDYLSIFAYYDRADRFARAVEEVYTKRSALKETEPLVQNAIEKYLELQFNNDLQLERINAEIKTRLLKKISEANQVEDDTEISRLSNQINKHEEAIQKFNSKFEKKKIVEKAITNSGYELSRIENEILSKKNSKFVNHGEDLENPNKLGLNNF